MKDFRGVDLGAESCVDGEIWHRNRNVVPYMLTQSSLHFRAALRELHIVQFTAFGSFAIMLPYPNSLFVAIERS